jgi:hypothetical protein
VNDSQLPPESGEVKWRAVLAIEVGELGVRAQNEVHAGRGSVISGDLEDARGVAKMLGEIWGFGKEDVDCRISGKENT